jgi:predicted methyltransferase
MLSPARKIKEDDPMTRKILLTALATSALAVTAISSPAVAKHHEGSGEKMAHADLDKVLADPRRADDSARDQFRNPKETLTFFGLKPDMTVAEYAPGGGWYTRIIAPYVAGHGKYIGLNFAPDPLPFPDDAKERVRGFSAKFPEDAAGWTGMPASDFAAFTSDAVPDDMKGTVDLVIIPRMMHNLMNWNVADNELRAIRDMLKDGGSVGIVQHRAKDDAPFSYANGSKGYLRTETVVNIMQAYGFELVGQSEVNANPKDTADYEGGVWTLPPRLSGDDAMDAKYEAIGESDRMTLLFKKLP